MTIFRSEEWRLFSAEVARHIEEYTIPRYGDAPDDYVSTRDAAWCVAQVGKYAARFAGPERFPGEHEQDLLKMAHCACLAWGKRHER